MIVDGAGALHVSGLKNDAFRVEANGAATLSAAGPTKRFDISCNGAGSVRAADLIAEEVSAKLVGAGSADVHAEKALDVSISGAGSVRYRGRPKVSQKILGVRTVSRKD